MRLDKAAECVPHRDTVYASRSKQNTCKAVLLWDV